MYRFIQFPLWKSNFSKTNRQNFKVNVYSNRVNIALAEYTLNLKFCRVFFEKFYFQIVKPERYGNGIRTTESLCLYTFDFVYFFCILSWRYRFFATFFFFSVVTRIIARSRPQVNHRQFTLVSWRIVRISVMYLCERDDSPHFLRCIIR